MGLGGITWISINIKRSIRDGTSNSSFELNISDYPGTKTTTVAELALS